MAAENPDRAQCAARDLKLLTSINEHGEAQDVPADDLRTAFFSLVRARGLCAAGRVDEALAIYDGVAICREVRDVETLLLERIGVV